MENYFLNARRYFLPGCHEGYWMGYRAAQGAWGKWRQLDKTVNSTYTHFGMFNYTGPGNTNLSIPEPNGKARNEMCLMANYSQAYNGSFGWADANCNNKYIFMCRIMSERRRLRAGVPLRGACGLQRRGAPHPCAIAHVWRSSMARRHPCPQPPASTTSTTRRPARRSSWTPTPPALTMPRPRAASTAARWCPGTATTSSTTPRRTTSRSWWAAVWGCVLPLAGWLHGRLSFGGLSQLLVQPPLQCPVLPCRPCTAPAAAQGALIPDFHVNYWMGLKNNLAWPNFTWTDPFAVRRPAEVAHPATAAAWAEADAPCRRPLHLPRRKPPTLLQIGPNASTYLHWGKGDGLDVPEEPNNLEPPEDCTVGNYSQSFDSVWGWADAGCRQRFVFMCKIRGERQGSCSRLCLSQCKRTRVPMLLAAQRMSHVNMQLRSYRHPPTNQPARPPFPLQTLAR